ncbi:hypothetical protein BT96DRAFT_1006145 [Gymnopus androsaceus JB14]|uniref:Uncharacterized protein n=1 Tax=Gymnopus androsaceus JB14 TaxID=1447944 RepID=A0A6A4GMF7_9AGAR|nr:hypothetical protein BT96DRAFT_1006145 [Gymnopus androsaceus JB14]
MHLLSRLYRKRTIATDDQTFEYDARVTPEPRASLTENANTPTSPFERRIHPDLNALAQELEHEPESVPLSRPSNANNPETTNFISLTPWIRNRRTTQTNLAGSQQNLAGNITTPVPVYLTSLDFGVGASPPDSDSQRSRASSSYPADTSAETSGTHSRDQSFHSPPSSGFTFGSVGPVYPPSPPTSLSTNPALRFSLFGGASEAVESQNVSVGEFGEFAIEDTSREPRPSTSMPSLNRHHRRLETSISNANDERSRPRVQDIFQIQSEEQQRSRSGASSSTGSPSSRLGRRRRKQPREHRGVPTKSETWTTRVDNMSESATLGLGAPFRLQQQEPVGPLIDEPSSSSPNLLTNPNADPVDSIPSTRPSQAAQNINMASAGTTTPPRSHSPSPLPGASGDEHNKSRLKGKSKLESSSSSRTSSPLRNVTPSTALNRTEFPSPAALVPVSVPPLPTSISMSTSTSSSSRPTTPRRSAMAKTSAFQPQPQPQAIPLATSTSASSLGSGKGKRKADEVEQQKQRVIHRATFAAEPIPRTHRTSTSSTASHYHYARRKRVRLSSGTSFATTPAVSENGVGISLGGSVRAPSRAGSTRRAPYPYPVHGSGSSSSPAAVRPSSRDSRTPTQSSLRGGSSGSVRYNSVSHKQRPGSKRGSIISQKSASTSIPISALISPHAPSISKSLNRGNPMATPYHMRDPRKPAPVHPTSWRLAFPSPGPEERGWVAGCMEGLGWGLGVGRLLEVGRRGRKSVGKGKEREGDIDLEKQDYTRGEDLSPSKLPVVDWIEGGGSPIHAWLFFLGFVLFPVWWIAGLFIGIPKTRRLGDEPSSVGGTGSAAGLGKSVVLDDPQVEHDAKSWRNRCRVLAVVSLFTYVPFIVLVVIFVPRS